MDESQISQQPYLTFFEDDTAEYDVIVDQSSSAPNLKEATWSAIQPLLPIIGERMGPEEFGLLLEYSPMPESFVEKLKSIQDERAKQPPPPDPEMMKVEAMKQAKAAELQMKQQEAGVQVQIDQQKSAAQMQLDQQKTAAQLELEREKAAAQIQLEREKAQAEIMLEQERANLEREKARMQLELEQARMGFDMQRQQSEMQFKQEATKSEMSNKMEMAKLDAALAYKDQPDEFKKLFHNTELSDAIGQMSQAMAMLAQSQMEVNRMLSESMAQLRDALTKPKQIVRGPDGRAIGVQ